MKKVITHDASGKVNGFLMELQKAGYKTTVYLTSVAVGCFKGYHLHTHRMANYVCISGVVKVILYHSIGPKFGEKWRREEHNLGEGDSLHIPINVPTGLRCIGMEDAWIVNFPDPPYDPNHKGEQVEYTEEELERSRIT